MARLIRCPRCQSSIDASNVPGGSTVRCADCGAMVRVPTGATGVHPRVPTPAPQPAVAQAQGGRGATKVRERQTALFRKMSGVKLPGDRKPSRGATRVGEGGTRYQKKKGSGAGIAIGAGAGAVALIVVIIIAMNNKNEAERDKQQAKAELKAKNEEYRKLAAQYEAEEASAASAPQAEKKPMRRTGEYVPPAAFEAGARKIAGSRGGDRELKLDAQIKSEYEALAAGNKFNDILKDDWRWIACAFDGVLNENEAVAKASLRVIHDFCNKRGIQTEKGGNPVRLDLSNSAEYRAGVYIEWAVEWWGKSRNQQAVRDSAPAGAVIPGAGAADASAPAAGPASSEEAVRDASRANWDGLMKDLRAGGGFEDVTRPEGAAYQRVKAMGKAAYPHLVTYIGNDDVMLSRAAVTVLNHLTGLQKPLPNEATKAQAKSEWETWVSANKDK